MLNASARRRAPADRPPLRRRLTQVWSSPGRARAAFGVAYALAVVITALAIWLVASAPGSGPIGPASRVLLLVLGFNLLVILGLAAVVGWRVLRLARGRASDPGARLHLRFVTLFAAAAVIPAIVVALFFGVLVTRGVESWFSQNVRTAVENGASIARTYLVDVSHEVSDDLQAMSGEMQQLQPIYGDRLSFSRALTGLAEYRGYSVYLLDRTGRILARGETADASPFLAPPPSAFDRADSGETPAEVTEKPDAVRALFPLEGYQGAYVYVVRPLSDGVVERLRNSEQSVVGYREREANQERIQVAFVLAYGETALLVLVGAVWLGITAAGAIAAPVARLVQAADRVAGGDLTARVETDRDPEEIAVLTRAFNRMTSDLQTQQGALKAASAEAQGRRRFIETVLSGVSAGVIGLDPNGRVSAVNRQALGLLALKEADTLGRPLAKVAPELAEVASHAGEADRDVDVTRGSETRRLRVRATGGEGGVVLTFDDITRLITAQRNAAWRDVARRIAHEIKNPLTPIQLSAERLRRKYRGQLTDDLETFDRCTDTIIRQVGDIGRMVDEFSSFARMPTPKFADEDAAELLRQAVFAQRVAQADIRLELAEPVPEVRLVCDGRMVGQALTNVLKNAGEAVQARRAADPDAIGGMIARLVVDEDQVAFVVEDDGIGLPDKDRDRLTEPYVTTREKGTGLGLAIVKRICEDHGGELRLADAVELSGARVSLNFPRARKGAAQPPAAVA
ncbi:PAS domain-containing sensor histidine kinase [Caulobacter sp. 17J80-11]|uniref:sensor histidine kinase NtrY-like n=1 Tax=Caulobacter sp. 17J80-11 TaxID=2763502 RepID=UPI0016535ED5|nr:PAS domain-containing sensor histidine kinase [Caulobacter sp. 17J80-11]